jgi:hypothetical protein
MVVMSEENSNTTTHHSASLAVGEISNTAAFSVRNWYDQHQAVHQHAHHSYFPQMPSQYSNGKKILNVFTAHHLLVYYNIFCVLFAIKK